MDVGDQYKPGKIVQVEGKGGVTFKFMILGINIDGPDTMTIQLCDDLPEREFQEFEKRRETGHPDRRDGRSMNDYENSTLQKSVRYDYPLNFKDDFIRKIEPEMMFTLEVEDYDPETTRYPAYKDRRNLTKYNIRGYACPYWTKSRGDGSTMHVKVVKPEGVVGVQMAYVKAGMAPACIVHFGRKEERS